MESQLVGRQLGPYRIRAVLGQGGMATVYKALTPNHQIVALKVLPPLLAQDPHFRERFRREAEAVRSLDHPNIVRLIEAGEIGGLSFMAMEYVEGGTLKDVLDQGAPDLTYTSRVISQLAAGLQYAHDRNVIHRDMKPSNVLIGLRGLVKLSDFGLAKVISQETGLSMSLTRSGANMGTARYMAPEQALNPSLVDARADIYSLGVILFELLCGSTPYDSSTPAALMYKHVNEPIPAIRQIVPTIPEVIERIVFKVLAKQPDDRFQSAQALAGALEDAVAGRPVQISLPEITSQSDDTQLDPQGVGLPGRFAGPAEQAPDPTTEISEVLDQMPAGQRAIFEEALAAFDAGERDEALALVRGLLNEDERLAPAWVLRSYLETNWADQMRCAENALAVAPDLVDARLRVDQVLAERLPVTYGRTRSLIPAVKEVREQAAAAYAESAWVEDESDPLNDPYQCPYCGVVNAPDRRRCSACRQNLMITIPPDPQPTPALRSLRGTLTGNLVMVIVQLAPALVWTRYAQVESGTRLKWILDQVFATEFAVMMAGFFTRVLDAQAVEMLLVIALARGVALGVVIVGLRMRAIWAYYLGILMMLFEIVWGVFVFAQDWAGPGTALLVSGLAGFSLFLLLNAAPNFTRGAERILVQANPRLRQGASYWRLGQQFERTGMWALAVAHYRAAAGAAPGQAAFYKALGIGYNKLGRYDRALPVLEQALHLAPADPDLPDLIRRAQVTEPPPAGAQRHKTG
ncbi:MAG: protein kinase [Anaerolineae bacterium]|nr:protein kinase [Anaerolineae bacterium]